MPGTCEDDSSEDELETLESKAKAALNVPGRNKPPGVERFQATEMESVTILIGICQQMWETK